MKGITLNEFSETLNYLIENNHKLIDNGDTPISVCIEGEAGLGKTSIIEQLAKSKNMTFVKINLAQIEEPSELIGFPYKEYKVIINNKEQWISSDLLSKMSIDYIPTNESRMNYAVPFWLPTEYNPNGTLLLLDDFSRANSLIIQSIMEIINTSSYISWSLPKYTNIVLSSNPDNGNYTVVSLDDAVKTRMITFKSIFDIKEWAKWADDFGIDNRAINFALLYCSEIFEPKNNITIANARSYTTFCRAISNIKDWSTDESLSLILQIAKGCFLEENNVIGSLFVQFINNKLDKLITAEEIINGSWDNVSEKLEKCVYKNDKYRSDIASILGLRILNYCDKNFNVKGLSNIFEKRIVEIYKHNKMLLSEDILHNIIKTLCKNHVSKTNKWFLNEDIRNISL